MHLPCNIRLAGRQNARGKATEIGQQALIAHIRRGRSCTLLRDTVVHLLPLKPCRQLKSVSCITKLYHFAALIWPFLCAVLRFKKLRTSHYYDAKSFCPSSDKASALLGWAETACADSKQSWTAGSCIKSCQPARKPGRQLARPYVTAFPFLLTQNRACYRAVWTSAILPPLSSEQRNKGKYHSDSDPNPCFPTTFISSRKKKKTRRGSSLSAKVCVVRWWC